jgi:hypothetical protein
VALVAVKLNLFEDAEAMAVELALVLLQEKRHHSSYCLIQVDVHRLIPQQRGCNTMVFLPG